MKAQRSAKDPANLSIEQRAALLSGHNFWNTKPLAGAEIPALTLCDGPHGVRLQKFEVDHLGIHESLPATCLPPAAAVGNSWDTEVAAKIGAAIGREARILGVHVCLGPGVNIKRTPLCGRNFEYYSEDPLLSGMLGAAHVTALQAHGVGASVKHFAANNQETDRMSVSAEIDERTLREIYLSAFERVVTTAHPATVMAAYNAVNGIPAAENYRLLTEILRAEWGFDGVVISDWGGVRDRVAALTAGLDLQMPGTDGASDAEIVQAVRDGRLDEFVVTISARRLATLATLATPAAEPSGELPVDEHHALARSLAADCAVLLKNDRETLPLHHSIRIAVIGALAVEPRFQGGGSSRIEPLRVDIPLEEIHTLGNAVTYAAGYGDDEDAETARVAAARVAAAADVAVLFVAPELESEGSDRTGLDLPAEQIELIRAVAAVSPRTVVVVCGGGVVSLEPWHDEVDAIVSGLLGQAAGGAFADILFGVVNPSGRLAETIPLRVQDTPGYLNFPGEAGRVRYGEGVMVGYRYYETAERAVRYRFGHGLSYTTFAVGDLTVTPTGVDTASVSLSVTNTGAREGKYVVQVYVATTAGEVRRPERELRAFTKIALAPSETRIVTVELDRRAFAYYDITDGTWVVAPGDYTIQIGENAGHLLIQQAIGLTGDVRNRSLSLDSRLAEWLAHPVAGPEVRHALTAHLSEEHRRRSEDNDLIQHVASMPLRQLIAFPGVSVSDETVTHLIELGRWSTRD